MTPAPIPFEEPDRLNALRQLLLLDSIREDRFDRVVAFAAQEFSCPIALVSLIDANRQWFKACHGMDVCETPRDISFCGHAIMDDAVFIIPDALQDERFADNPLVTGAPFIRFYAGAPLHSPSGHRIGTLCLIDTSPRRFDETDLAILESLRDLVADELQPAGDDA